jgi:magnesium-protoporphyrin IX monomethyl ester (oxidative) cyclase
MPVAEFGSVALLKADQPIPAFLSYGISDLVELAGLAAFIRELVDDIAIPVGPCDRDPISGFAAYAKKRRPQLVGISTYTCGARSAFAYAKIAKQYGAYVVVGGYHPSALPEEMLSNPDIDAVVRGEGEETLAELVTDGPSPQVLGLSYKDGSNIAHNPERPLITDLDRLSLPLRQLRPGRFGLDGQSYHTDTIYTSRGCKARCAFCANHLVGKQWRQRSIDKVMAELATIPPGQLQKPKKVKLWDPNFLTDVERISELCKQIIAAGFHQRFRFVAETRIEDIIRAKEILPLLKRAGICQLGSGIESPNQETLKLHRKGVKIEWVDQAAQLLDDNGIHFGKFFIIGHSNESVADILQYPTFAATPRHRSQNSFFFALTPYPGTRIFDEYQQQGLIKSFNWDLYTNYCAVVEPAGIPRYTLQALLGAVIVQCSLNKRFARGEPFSKLAGKTLALLLANARALLLDDACSPAQAADNIWQALGHLRQTPARPSSEKRSGALALRAIRLFHRNQPPFTLRIYREDGSERLLPTFDTRDSAVPRLTTLNLDTSHLLWLARTIDPRRDGHDLITLYLAPRKLRLGWVISLLWQAVKVLGILGVMAGFHLRKTLSQ